MGTTQFFPLSRLSAVFRLLHDKVESFQGL
jgi:hypothetical protein